jgi:hypothetical protein
MKDLFGNRNPIQIEVEEWWFNGRIILKQKDTRLPKWVSFEDNGSPFIEVHSSKKEAINFAIQNPCTNPDSNGLDYIKLK